MVLWRMKIYVHMAERALADAEEVYRLEPSEANQRRSMSAWSFVRRERQRAEAERHPPCDGHDSARRRSAIRRATLKRRVR